MIELSPESADALRTLAEVQGQTIEQWLARLAEMHVETGAEVHLQRSNPEE